MEHEVFVPVPVGPLREALSDPERVARAVPGLQQDAGTPPVAGRLKVRVGGHTITYRGTLRVTGLDDGSYAIEGDATEARGTGSVKAALTVRLTSQDEGTAVSFEGTATADGRVTELPEEAVTGAVTRLLTRFAENLGDGAEAAEAAEQVDEAEAVATDGPDPEAETAPEPGAVEEARDAEPSTPLYEAEVPPSALDPFADDDLTAAGEPPAEAAHARRTMIGRSAEEVDHAPPRGRYTPIPAPESVVANTALRWAAPAAALVLASAIVVGRAWRRRR